MPTSLAHLAVGARRVVALRTAVPEAHRPPVAHVFADLDPRLGADFLPTQAHHEKGHRMSEWQMQIHELDRWLASSNKAITETKASNPTRKSAAPVRIASFDC